MQRNRVPLAARSARAALIALLLTLVPAGAEVASGSAAPATDILIPSSGWHGRAIREPHPHHAVRAPVADRPLRRWSAGTVSFGTGFQRPGGSERVREVQRRLRRLGYRPGPVDGLFGRLTRASVAWFQLKHGLVVNGRATLATLRHLRARTGAVGERERARAERHAVATGRRAEPWEAFRRLTGARLPAGDGRSGVERRSLGWVAVLVLGLLLLGAAALRSIVPDRSSRTASASRLADSPADEERHRQSPRALAQEAATAAVAEVPGRGAHAATGERDHPAEALNLADFALDDSPARRLTSDGRAGERELSYE